MSFGQKLFWFLVTFGLALSAQGGKDDVEVITDFDFLREPSPCFTVARAASFPIQFDFMVEHLPEEVADWHLRTIQEIDSFFPGLRKPDYTMHAKVYEVHPGGSVNASPRTNEMELDVEGVNSRVADRRLINTGTAHEYGHHLYHLNIGKKLWAHPKYQMKEEEHYQLRQEVYRMREEDDRLASKYYRFSSVDVSTEKAQALDAWKALRAKREEKEKKSRAMDQWGAFWETHPGDAMGELLSDLVAVLHQRDLRAVRTHLGESKDVNARDFSDVNPSQGWNKNEVHALYGPARSFLGKYLAKNDFYRGKEEILVGKVLDAMAAELADLYATRELDAKYVNGKHDFDLSPEILNQRLIRHLETHL